MKRLVWTLTAAVALSVAAPLGAQPNPSEPAQLEPKLPAEPSLAEPELAGEAAAPGWRNGGGWKNASDWVDETQPEPEREFEEAPADQVIPDDPE